MSGSAYFADSPARARSRPCLAVGAALAGFVDPARPTGGISFSIDSIARRGIASVMRGGFQQVPLRKAATIARCDRDVQASIWLVILEEMTLERRKSGLRRAGASGGAIGGAIGACRSFDIIESFWRQRFLRSQFRARPG